MQANIERPGEVPPPDEPSTVPTPRQPLDDGLSDFPTAVIPVIQTADPDTAEEGGASGEAEQASADAPAGAAEPDVSDEPDADAGAVLADAAAPIDEAPQAEAPPVDEPPAEAEAEAVDEPEATTDEFVSSSSALVASNSNVGLAR